MRARLLPLAAAFGVLLAGLGARAALDGDPAKYSGVALYTVLVYCLVLVIAPGTRPWITAAIALGFSWAVEFFQLTPVPARLAGNALARLVLGSTFNPPDLLWYAAGAAVAFGAHLLARRTRPVLGTGRVHEDRQ
ncbi:membrane protein [Actinorhabdospora filicis]|uniref:Membrane protein n=1 Tax=Actinorhabdospora filicis TaxID=1785913 RepID=A0A9W6WB56_9ACTN|nr:DUF2809 domain-containing protein [Actinorhabdospora filicis]GLZ80299.1 membrane protein [Actinorhabdospora filicis]